MYTCISGVFNDVHLYQCFFFVMCYSALLSVVHCVWSASVLPSARSGPRDGDRRLRGLRGDPQHRGEVPRLSGQGAGMDGVAAAPQPF